MKKHIFALACISLFNCALAEEAQNDSTRVITQEVQDKCKVIKVEVLIYPDQMRSNSVQSEWNETVQRVADCAHLTKSDPNSLEKAYETVVETITNAHVSPNIHASMTIRLGDGVCPKGVCAEDCECLKKYNGICPCGFENVSKCHTEEE